MSITEDEYLKADVLMTGPDYRKLIENQPILTLKQTNGRRVQLSAVGPYVSGVRPTVELTVTTDDIHGIPELTLRMDRDTYTFIPREWSKVGLDTVKWKDALRQLEWVLSHSDVETARELVSKALHEIGEPDAVR